MPPLNKQNANRAKRRARVDEGLAVVQVVHARVRRRYAELTLALLERAESARERVAGEGRAARTRLASWIAKAQRVAEGDARSERKARREKRS